ncbi:MULTISPECIES: hypothetical protein [Dyella]|uniref:Uncharacterized protein n=2 Tax=Dyella TaxID=231454 RepID=A0A4V2NMG5_9GAMM|nr:MULTISPECIES: hypothetical protein [Dyella]TBR39186.1 hypothetical protein EYV96_02840 [Dyella terrae]TCI13227.1 hypothetical protein EZM97_08025 [Dyella soli]
MNIYQTLVPTVVLAILAGAVAGAWLYRRRTYRRTASMHTLIELADRLEGDLKSCRSGLQQAHAVMSLNPDLPAASEQEAHHAVDAGLRSLLQQRIWIRDKAAGASQAQLDDAVSAMTEMRAQLAPLLQALSQAQHALDDAMREHIQRGP